MPNTVKLAALVVIAVIGAFVMRALFVAASRPENAPQPSTLRVRVAADDLPDGLLLRDTDLLWKDMPSNRVPPGALVQTQAGNSGDLKGDLLRHAVRAGTPLGTADVISPSAPGFLAAALTPGMRAISVAIDDVSGNAGLIEPGDYVDILLTQQIRANTTSSVSAARSVESETVAARVRVLAVGSAFRRPKDDGSEAKSNVRTATFEVTPATAEAITVAAHLGNLSLALRSFATRDRHERIASEAAVTHTPPVWAGDVSSALRAIDSPSTSTSQTKINARPAPHVLIYRGSTVQAGDAPSAAGAMGPAGVPPLPSGTLPAAPARTPDTANLAG